MTIPEKLTVVLYSCWMRANRASFLLITTCWGLALVLPHFQTNPGVLELILDSSVALLLFLAFERFLNSGLKTSKILKFALVLISLGGFLAGVSAMALNRSSIYDFWSHLGSGTMQLNGKVFLFGDLAHLTSAASCSKPISIGNNICDPWGRLFNQNPQVGKFFRLLHVTNVNFLGFIAVLIFILSLVAAIRFLKIKNVSFYILLCTPVVILAVDRGNEILTITLLMLGLYALRRNYLAAQFFGALTLVIAVFFKLWPIFLVLLLLIFQWRRIKTLPKIFLGLSILYWLLRIHQIKEIMNATQKGSPYGLSFGLKLFSHSGLTPGQILSLASLTIVWVVFLIQSGNTALNEFINSTNNDILLPWLVPIMLTYSLIWLTSDSYIYRMVIFIPLVLILSRREIAELEWSKFVIVAILVTAVTSRLAITTTISSALALYFIYISQYAWRNRIRSIKNSK